MEMGRFLVSNFFFPVYMAQWPLSATGEVVQYASSSLMAALIRCHFLTNWAGKPLVMYHGGFLVLRGMVLRNAL